MTGGAGHEDLAAAFAAGMDACGPFEPNPALAIAVSGGADSMALALLAHAWAIARQGKAHAFVVDHGLRAASAAEAQITIERLASVGIPGTLLQVTGLLRGAAMAERARIARYQALTDACRNGGWLHLLLGHHASDQIETMMMRALGNSLSQGLAAMPVVLDTTWVRLLRPLLTILPDRLRTFLRSQGIGWVEDPSNRDRLALRSRLRQRLAEHQGCRAAEHLLEAARRAGEARARDEAAIATELAGRAMISPEGYALMSPGRISTGALAILIRTVGGAAYTPGLPSVADLAAAPRSATLSGVRILPAGRVGAGFLVVREEAAMAGPAPAERNLVWDRRFRLIAGDMLPAGTTIGALGADAAPFRRQFPLPSAVLRTLPAIRVGNLLAGVPHLRYAVDKSYARVGLLFDPPRPLAGPSFRPI